MRTIQDIYTKYKIPPNLQLHMYQVTAFGLYVGHHLQPDIHVDIAIITKTNLLHDMGNIIKFDFSPHRTVGIPTEEIPYWKEVQSEVIAKYGVDEDVATDAIAAEIGVEQDVLDILSQHGIDKAKNSLEKNDWNIKIIRLSDERIAPSGVVSLDARYQDLLKRYENTKHDLSDSGYINKRRGLMMKLEAQIQERCSIDLQKITNADIEPYIQTLKKYEMPEILNSRL